MLAHIPVFKLCTYIGHFVSCLYVQYLHAVCVCVRACVHACIHDIHVCTPTYKGNGNTDLVLVNVCTYVYTYLCTACTSIANVPFLYPSSKESHTSSNNTGTALQIDPGGNKECQQA